MVNFDLLMLLGFAIILGLIMLVNRHKVKVEKILFPLVYMVLYRTKIGLNLMDKFGRKHERLVRIVGEIGVVLGFLGMFAILIMLIIGVYKFLLKRTT